MFRLSLVEDAGPLDPRELLNDTHRPGVTPDESRERKNSAVQRSKRGATL